jgi:hypothetical protein
MALNTKTYYGSTNTYISGGYTNTTGTNNIAIGKANGIYGTSFNTTISKAKYHILGEDVEVEGYIDGTTAMMISTINLLGKPYYDELKKNNVSFSNEIEDFLKVKFKVMERDTKIDSILDYSDHVSENLDTKKSIEPPTF